MLLAMIFLLLMAMVAGTVMQNSILAFRMAGNDQFREEAFQKAQGIASAISEAQDNFPVSGGVGYIICRDAAATAGCSADLAALDANVVSVPAGVTVDYQIERQGPLLLETIPFRLSYFIRRLLFVANGKVSDGVMSKNFLAVLRRQ